jgi:coenzyme PQQ biosynthesis protein PqqD
MDDTAKPRLAPGCRLHVPSEGDPVLLIPEGALRLIGSALKIIELVNGQRTVDEIIRSLVQQYSTADSITIRVETNSLLDRLKQRGVLRC